MTAMFTWVDLLNSWLLLLRLRLISRIFFKLRKTKKNNNPKQKKNNNPKTEGNDLHFKINLQNRYDPIRRENTVFGLKVCNINFTNCFISTTMFLYLSHLDSGETFFSTKIHLESLTTGLLHLNTKTRNSRIKCKNPAFICFSNKCAQYPAVTA